MLLDTAVSTGSSLSMSDNEEWRVRCRSCRPSITHARHSPVELGHDSSCRVHFQPTRIYTSTLPVVSLLSSKREKNKASCDHHQSSTKASEKRLTETTPVLAPHMPTAGNTAWQWRHKVWRQNGAELCCFLACTDTATKGLHLFNSGLHIPSIQDIWQGQWHSPGDCGAAFRLASHFEQCEKYTSGCSEMGPEQGTLLSGKLFMAREMR